MNSRRPRAFSLIEMLATVAALVILLGLMVSLARYVRRQASDQLTKQLLARLDVLVRRYHGRYQTPPVAIPFVPPSAATQTATRGAASLPTTQPLLVLPAVTLISPAAEESLPDEAALQQNATANNRSFVQALRIEARRYPTEYASLPQSFFAEGTLPDAWGTPIVYMPALHPAVGMAMENRPFFVSAGPDRQFRTLEDNLYSYEEGEENGGVVSSQ